MECSAHFVYAPSLAAYDHGPQHPLRPERFVLTRELLAAYGVFERPGVIEAPPRLASDEELRLVHTTEYVAAIQEGGGRRPGDWPQFGLGPGDNPVFPDMHAAAALVAGATLAAAEAVLSGEAAHAFSPAGGLHHAMANRASGFCVYNDPAIAIAWLLRQGVGRVAYLDLDVHHGDGVQAAFYDDARVLTISIHESGQYLFPGTGGVSEVGGPGAEGSSVNIPLPPGTGDAAWLHAFTELVPPLIRRWSPEVLVTQLGCDTHATDPLAHLQLSTRAYREAGRVMHELAHETAAGRWLATGGGGYQWATVVPRAWTIYFAEMCGEVLEDRVPTEFLDLVESTTGAPPPPALSEEAARGLGVEAVTGVVQSVKRAIFPLHGLA